MSAPISNLVPAQPPALFDGPAELPRVYLRTAMADTPAPGALIAVGEGDDLQSALNNAHCGDTIALQAGTVFAGEFKLPAKPCDDAHWVVIRSSAPDSRLPPEGTRLTPCYAGVASLPARPAFNCQSTNVVTAQLLGTGSDGPLTFLAGANHYRFIGLEITRVLAAPSLPSVYQIAAAADGVAAHHIVFDRVWAHGTAQDETNHGIRLNGITYAAIIDSFFTDFHCVSVTGGCTDAQAISGGNGNLPGGPYKIVNNFIEAAGEGVLFGGADGSIIASDIEVRRNHFFKPLTWLAGQPGYVGGVDGNPFVVKNHFELKDAQRVLFEANVLENTWGGFSQSGWAILLTPRGSWAAVQDVTIRYCTITHAGAGMTLSGTLDEDHGNIDSLAAQRWSIHDVIMDGIDAAAYSGTGNLFQIANWLTTKSLNHITIDHVTGITDAKHGVFTTGEDASSPISADIVLTNNIFLAGQYTVWPTGFTNPCSSSLDPLTLVSSCWNPYTFTANAFILPSVQADALWPSGNYFPPDVSAVQFTNYNQGNGGDYTLLPGSPYKNSGIDGKDLGADIEFVKSEIDGVY